MDGARERIRQSGKQRGAAYANMTAINSPSHFSNTVVQTGSHQNSSTNDTDLQRAITDYQHKVSKRSSNKTKNSTARVNSKNAAGSNNYGAPISQKRLADTYMVGGCSMDLNNTHSSQRKATMILNANQSYSTKQTTAGLISHHSGSGHNKQSTHMKSRPSNANHKSSGVSSGPMQLEPNPVFSIIDE